MVSMNSIPQLAPVNAATRLVMEPKLNLLAAPPEGIDSETAWEQVLARDAQARFFYGVTTTGVFCRPGCASRRPLRANVRFFRTAAAAQAAGFRACQRCSALRGQTFGRGEVR